LNLDNIKDQLKNLKVAQGYERIVGDLVIIEPRDMGTDETGEPEEWRWLQPYVLIRGKHLEGWQCAGGTDSVELRGHFLSDIKANGLIYYWNPTGQVRVHGSSTLVIEAIDSEVVEQDFSQN
jgi:hypothetical protein